MEHVTLTIGVTLSQVTFNTVSHYDNLTAAQKSAFHAGIQAELVSAYGQAKLDRWTRHVANVATGALVETHLNNELAPREIQLQAHSNDAQRYEYFDTTRHCVHTYPVVLADGVTNWMLGPISLGGGETATINALTATLAYEPLP